MRPLYELSGHHWQQYLSAAKHYRSKAIEILEQMQYAAMHPMILQRQFAENNSQQINDNEQPQMHPVDLLWFVQRVRDTLVTEVAHGTRNKQQHREHPG